VIRALLLTLALAAPARSQGAADGQMLNLSCVEALASIDEARLAGVFSFVPEKDSPTAFADLVARDPKAMKRYLKKLNRDLKQAGGLSQWDHDVVVAAVTLYGSPMAAMLPKQKPATIEHLASLAQAPAMTLQELTAKRGGQR
jgi:hypothetical protein